MHPDAWPNHPGLLKLSENYQKMRILSFQRKTRENKNGFKQYSTFLVLTRKMFLTYKNPYCSSKHGL